MSKNALNALAALELAAVVSPLIAALTRIKNGDGSVASVVGEGMALKGEMVAIIPTLEKVGINNVAGLILDELNALLAKVTPSDDAPNPAPAPAPAVAPQDGDAAKA